MDRLIEILKIVLSWPFAVIFCTVFLAVFFRAALREWISRLAITGKYGGAEFTAKSQQLEAAKSEKEPEAAIQQTAPKDQPLQAEPETDWKKVSELWRTNAYLWEYRYLNYYLVFATQHTLDTFYNLNDATSFATFDAWATPFIPNPKERQAIIDALLQHHLIEDTGGLLKITPKGREYVNWRGKMAPLNPAATKSH